MKKLIALTGAAATALCLVGTSSPAMATVADASETTATPVVEKSETGSYVVIMKADPLLKEIEQKDLNSGAAKAKRATKQKAQDKVVADAGIAAAAKTTSFTNALDGFGVRTDLAGAQKMAKNKDVAVVIPDELRQAQAFADSVSAAMSTHSGQKQVANALQNFLGLDAKKGAYAKGINGEGVLVGVIDTGIWPEHPMLADDGSFPAAPALSNSPKKSCDFGNTAHNPNDAAFTCNNKLVGARTFLDTYKRIQGGLLPDEFDSARDDGGHGTHTATTAAGNANVQSEVFGVEKDVVSGIAPRAQVIAYKALGDGGGYSSDLSAAIDQAVADGVDVINYSIGGGARVVSADTLSFLFAADAGVFAAVSAGNSGPGPKTVGGPANVPWVTGVGATTFPRNYAGSVVLVKGRVWERGASEAAKAEEQAKAQAEADSLAAEANTSDSADASALESEANAAAAAPDKPVTWKGKVFRGTSITKGTSLVGIIDGARAGLAGKANPGLCVEGSLDPAKVSGKIVLCERGVNGRVAKGAEVMRAGGVGMVLFNAVDTDTMFSDSHFIPTVMMDKTPGENIRAWVNSQPNPLAQLRNDGINKLWHYSPTVTYFSSRGETIPNGDIIKPDISAPGAQIMAGMTPMPIPGSAPAGELWQAIAGTSMSGPVVAGSYALLKQAHPEWTPAIAKSALMTNAFTKVRDNDRKTPATPFATGSGMAYLGNPDSKGTAFQPGLAYDAGFNDYLGFLCAEGREAFGNPDATCAALAGAGIPTTAADLNYASIGMESVAGTKTVKRTVTNVSNAQIRAKAKVKVPAGYKVKVTPDRIALNPGESATFEVTLTNNGAPAGEWRFGDLTWEGNGYSVRSPIAAKGVAIATASTVTGTGTSGTASIESIMGSAGTYEAVPHGLTPATHTNGTVFQDPDQTYPSADDGAGVVKLPFDLTGVDHARWKLQLDGGSDLDLFLHAPDGSIVATSGNGGTDEQIDLASPAPGTYTLVVHGWAAPEEGIAFDVRSWLVPAASGGSLTVTSGSPATVTPGQKVTVGIAWSGLTAGDEYLGTVSHVLNGSKVASTAVEVKS